MTFGESVQTCFSKYVTFEGRAARSEFWYFALFVTAVSIVLSIVDSFVLGMPDFQPISTLFTLATFLPYLAVTARRLHDTDRSGWWQLLPLTGAIVVMVGVATWTMILSLLGSLVFIGLTILLIVWLATAGASGDNRFGADPLA